MLVKIPYFPHRFEDGSVDFDRKSWALFDGVARVNVEAHVKEEYGVAKTRHPTFLYMSYVGYCGHPMPDDFLVPYKTAILHFDEPKDPVSVMFDTGMFVCNDQGKTIDRF